MESLRVRYIQIPVSPEEFKEIETLKGEQSWREFALPRLGIGVKKKN